MKKRPRKSVLNKDIFREILKTKTRFLSITFMIMLGVFVSVGMKITTPIMKETIVNYVEKSNLYDIKISSSQNLEEDDFKVVKKLKDVSYIEKGYEVTLPIKDKGVDITLSAISDNFNKPTVVDGRKPIKDDEILADSWLKKYYNLGDIIHVAKGIEKNFREKTELKNTQYRIVGFADTVEHIDLFEDKKTVTEDVLGIPRAFGYIKKDNFNLKKFNYLLIKNDNLGKLRFGETEHKKESLKLKQEVMKSLRKRPDEIYTKKRDKIVAEQKKLDENKYKIQFALANKEKISETKVVELREQLEKIDDGIAEITKILDIIVKPNYTVASQYDLKSVYEFYKSADKLDAISNIFSGFFFMIAILVSLTTMTRMAEEQRIQVGTLKALGYRNTQITRKYFVYGLLASTIGIIGGLVIGHSIILKMIYQAYSDSTQLPDYVISFQPVIIIVICLISYACTTLSAKIAVDSMLKQRVAVLLRGKPPKKGTRIFLEKIAWLWKRMNFFQKVSARNIFRYKARMWMTIIGIAGCTGLLYLGFALKSSISGIETKQFNELFTYDVSVAYNPYSKKADLDKFNSIINNSSIIDKVLDAYGENTYVEGSTNKKATGVNVIVFDKGEKINEFINFRDMKQEAVNLDDKGALISVKLAQVIKVDEGSKLSLNISSQDISAKIKGVVENYIGHSIYMNNEYFERITNKNFKKNTKLIKLKNGDQKQLKKLIDELSSNKVVVAVENMTIGKTVLKTLGESMNIVVLVMVVCSILLAMVVLYNLTNINISERIRELSTIKVLGFYSNEVTKYVYRETLLLTFLGQVLGLLMGNFMHSYVVWELPPESVMLDATSVWINYLISIGITFGITLVISFIIHNKLKNVNMVEALKDIE